MIEKIKQPTHAVTMKLPLETYAHLQALCKVHRRSTNMMIQHMIHNTPLPSVADELMAQGATLSLYNYASGQR